MDLLKQLIQVLLVYAKENGYGDLTIAVTIVSVPVIAILLFIGWWIGKRSAIATITKTYAESSKALSESRLKYQELLAAVEDRRNDLNEEIKRLDAFLIEMRNVTRRGGVEKLREARDRLCEAHSKSYMPVFARYLELCHSVLPKDECYLRMVGEIIPALAFHAKMIERINSESLFDRTRTGAVYTIDLREAKVIFARARMGIPIWRVGARWELHNLRKRWGPFLRK